MEHTPSPPQTRRGTLALILAGVIAVGIFSAPGSLAYLQTQHQSETISLHTGSAALTVSEPVLMHPTLAPGTPPLSVWYTPLPEIVNEGSVPLALTIAVSSDDPTAASFSGNVEFTFWTTPRVCNNSPAADHVWKGTALTGAHTVIGEIDPGEGTHLCAYAALPADAPPSTQDADETVSFEIEVIGMQVAE